MNIKYSMKSNHVFNIFIYFEYLEENIYVQIRNAHIGDIVSKILNYDKPLYQLTLQTYDDCHFQSYIDIADNAEAIINETIDIKTINDDEIIDLYNHYKEIIIETGEEAAKHIMALSIEAVHNMANLYKSLRNKTLKCKNFDTVDIDEFQKTDIKEFINTVLCDDESIDSSNYTMEERLYSFLSMYNQKYSDFLNYGCTILTTVNKQLEEFGTHHGKNFYQIINEARNNNYNLKIVTESTFPTFFDFIIFLLTYMLQNNILLKKCKNCGKYFYPEKRSDAIFCDDISPQDNTKTCKEYGRYINQQNKIKETPTLQLHKQIYNKFRNQYNRDKTIENQERLNNFINKSDRFKNDVKHNVKSESEYLEWLEHVRKTGEV